MPKLCYDCKNLDSLYEWDGIDETIAFRCKKGKSRSFVEDLSQCDCDKHNPYKNRNRIPNEFDRRFFFEIGGRNET